MKNAQARTVYLKEYLPPAFLIDKTDLRFELFEDCALVQAQLSIRFNDADNAPDQATLILNGQYLQLERLLINDQELSKADYQLDGDFLTIPDLAGLLGNKRDDFSLTCHTRIEPQNNTALEGLYKSRTMFCTQCEAEGFRRITYYLDRPDVMSVFTTTIVADFNKYPVLLSNGNQIDSGAEGDGNRHWVTWHDPFPKPCYLFALVAGDLACVEDRFVTLNGRDVALRIFVEEKDLDKCEHAMRSLKNAMRWDEEVYGREYDLDIFMIVAVDDFNMGAMENKGLNIFNTSCVLANPKTTVDSAFQRVEGVVAHEYFHNWSGNRVTCRDWFQLSLKEGFTVFRDSEFSADMGSRTVKRVEDVALLRTAQFAEDAGPMAHPIRPDSYMEISNFYTMTVYEKGAEVVRMISHILGPENYRKGTDLYFARHDGQAVTTEEFVLAMEEASGVDLTQFRNWYTQAGTPVLDVMGRYNAATQNYRLTIRQHCPATPGQKHKLPFHIPLRLGLLDRNGQEIPLHCNDSIVRSDTVTDMVLQITEPEQEYMFQGVKVEPIPSLLRGFSAPVRLNFAYTPEDLYFLMVHDSDGFNRWNASQQLAAVLMRDLQVAYLAETEFKLPKILEQAYAGILRSALDNPGQDGAMVSQLLTLPAESYLIEIADVAEVEAIHAVREFLARSLAESLEVIWRDLYLSNTDSCEFSVDARAVARRMLKNTALAYLSRLETEQSVELCAQQFYQADNMTDESAALNCLVNSATAVEQGVTAAALEKFYKKWQHEPLVVDLWFSSQARSQLPETLERVQQLMLHPAFNLRNPNKVRSVIGAFSAGSLVNFHAANGQGYRFLADQVLALDPLNPQIASRLLTPLTRWKKFDHSRAGLMKGELIRIRAASKLSRDVFEVVEKSLA